MKLEEFAPKYLVFKEVSKFRASGTMFLKANYFYQSACSFDKKSFLVLKV